MSDRELVLGYDARQKDFNAERLWPLSRREQYLLRLDVQRPLSTDTAVWPASLCQPIHNHSPTGWIGPLAPLWERLDSLKYAWAQRPGSGTACFISITLVGVDPSDVAISRFQERRGEPIPGMISPLWEFLGYDVSDEGFLSGLMNCSYPEDLGQLDSYRARWGKHLNSRHLFDHVSTALLFKEEVDRRVPEHAPFFVFGLWLI